MNTSTKKHRSTQQDRKMRIALKPAGIGRVRISGILPIDLRAKHEGSQFYIHPQDSDGAKCNLFRMRPVSLAHDLDRCERPMSSGETIKFTVRMARGKLIFDTTALETHPTVQRMQEQFDCRYFNSIWLTCSIYKNGATVPKIPKLSDVVPFYPDDEDQTSPTPKQPALDLQAHEPALKSNRPTGADTTQLLRQLLVAEEAEWVGVNPRMELRQVAERIRREM